MNAPSLQNFFMLCLNPLLQVWVLISSGGGLVEDLW